MPCHKQIIEGYCVGMRLKAEDRLIVCDLMPNRRLASFLFKFLWGSYLVQKILNIFRTETSSWHGWTV